MCSWLPQGAEVIVKPVSGSAFTKIVFVVGDATEAIIDVTWADSSGGTFHTSQNIPLNHASSQPLDGPWSQNDKTTWTCKTSKLHMRAGGGRMSLRVNILVGRREGRLESLWLSRSPSASRLMMHIGFCLHEHWSIIHTHMHTHIQDMVTASMVTALSKARLVILFMLVNNACRVSITGRSTRNKSLLGSQYLTHRIRTQRLLLLNILISMHALADLRRS